MARTIAGRLVVTGDLVARTALHVGGIGEDVTSDMPLARDGAGRFVVPGTSLAGAFRAWCERAFPSDSSAAISLWGSADEGSAASSVFIEDLVAGTEESLHAEVRDGVGIDREWGTAAAAIKYDRAVLPRGTRLPLRMTIEYDNATADAAHDMAAGLVAALADGEVCLGAAKTRGLGRVVLENGSIERFDIAGPTGTLALLRRLAWESPDSSGSAARPAASAKAARANCTTGSPTGPADRRWLASSVQAARISSAARSKSSTRQSSSVMRRAVGWPGFGGITARKGIGGGSPSGSRYSNPWIGPARSASRGAKR